MKSFLANVVASLALCHFLVCSAVFWGFPGYDARLAEAKTKASSGCSVRWIRLRFNALRKAFSANSTFH